MAKAKPTSILRNISGTLDSSENVVFRVRNSQTEVYTIHKESRAPMTPAQARSAADFGIRSRLASVINRSPTLSAPFRARYNALPHDRRPCLLYHYILSSLSDPELLSQYGYLEQNE